MSAASCCRATVSEELSIEISNLEFSHSLPEKMLRIPELKIIKGDVVAILGPSGCGKTTFLQIISGLHRSTSYTSAYIRLAGMSISEAVTTGLVSLSFQTPVLMPWLTAAENVMLPLQLRNTIKRSSDAQAEVMEALKCVQMAEWKDTFPRALSSGMRSRVAVAQAMVSRSKILLLDEVFGTLDEPTRVEVDVQLRRLNDSHMQSTIVLVTHSIEEALLLADRVLIFRKKLENDTDITILEDKVIRLPSRDRRIRATTLFQDLKSEIEDLFVAKELTR